VLYKGAWGAWRHFHTFAPDPDYDVWGLAQEVLGIVAVVALVEFTACFVVVALTLGLLSRFVRDGVVLAGIVAAVASIF